MRWIQRGLEPQGAILDRQKPLDAVLVHADRRHRSISPFHCPVKRETHETDNPRRLGPRQNLQGLGHLAAGHVLQVQPRHELLDARGRSDI